MPDAAISNPSTTLRAGLQSQITPFSFVVRRAHFPDEITFHAPGLKRFKTSEYL